MLRGVLLIAAAILFPAVAILCLAYKAGMIEVILLRFTYKWYGAFVQALSPKSRVLDVGIGFSRVRSVREIVAGYWYPYKLQWWANTVIGTVRILLSMEIEVVGAEEKDNKFQESVATLTRAGLRRTTVLHCNSICEASFRQVFSATNRFNAVCFSSPLRSLPDPVAALRASTSLLKDGGMVYIPHVFKPSPSMASQILTPIFKLLHLTSVAEVEKVVAEADMEVIDDLPAVGEGDKAVGESKSAQAARILVVQRRAQATKNSAPSDSNVRSRKSAEKSVESEL